jgi:hypothetical protein
MALLIGFIFLFCLIKAPDNILYFLEVWPMPSDPFYQF